MCVLRVRGEDFDIDAFLASSKLTPYKIFRRGERSRDGTLLESSGFCIDVSQKDFSDLPGQVSDAIAFLESYRDDLSRVVATAGIDDIRLDFPVNLRIEDGVNLAQFDYFPPELVERAGALKMGLELSIYPGNTPGETDPA